MVSSDSCTPVSVDPVSANALMFASAMVRLRISALMRVRVSVVIPRGPRPIAGDDEAAARIPTRVRQPGFEMTSRTHSRIAVSLDTEDDDDAAFRMRLWSLL